MQGFPVKTIDASDPAWKLLGELEWTFSAHAEDIISTQLEEILEPLDLPADFRTRFFNSAQERIIIPVTIRLNSIYTWKVYERARRFSSLVSGRLNPT
jgi:hypothetical protein